MIIMYILVNMPSIHITCSDLFAQYVASRCIFITYTYPTILSSGAIPLADVWNTQIKSASY